MTNRTSCNLQLNLYMTRLMQYKRQSCLNPPNINTMCADVDYLLNRLNNLKLRVSDPYKVINKQLFDQEINIIKKDLDKIN